MTVGGVKVTNQYFAAVTQESSQFAQDPADGLMGLAFPALSNLNHVRTPFCAFVRFIR